jgi:hypothetical protein
MVRRSAASRRAWKDLWKLLEANQMAEAVYAPMVTVIAIEFGLAEDASNAIYRPLDPETRKRTKRTLEEYLAGRNSQTAQELTLLRDSLKQAAKLAEQFGTSPLAEKRVGAGEKSPGESPLMEYVRTANERMKRRSS